MAERLYTLQRGLDSRLPHSIVALPLIVSLVFCFGFVMMTDKPIDQGNHAASREEPLTSAPPSTLPTIQLHNEDALTIITAGPNGSLDTALNGLNTTSPQTGNGRNNLQSQNNSSQSILNSLGNSLNGVQNQKY